MTKLTYFNPNHPANKNRRLKGRQRRLEGWEAILIDVSRQAIYLRTEAGRLLREADRAILEGRKMSSLIWWKTS